MMGHGIETTEEAKGLAADVYDIEYRVGEMVYEAKAVLAVVEGGTEPERSKGADATAGMEASVSRTQSALVELECTMRSLARKVDGWE